MPLSRRFVLSGAHGPGVGQIQIAVAGHGDLNILRQLPPPLNHRIKQLLGPLEGAKVWESITPFVPPRYLKDRGKNTLLGQINAELASRRLPEVQQIDPVSSSKLTRSLRHYVRRRIHGGTPPPIDVGYGLRLIFREPLQGPLVLIGPICIGPSDSSLLIPTICDAARTLDVRPEDIGLQSNGAEIGHRHFEMDFTIWIWAIVMSKPIS